MDDRRDEHVHGEHREHRDLLAALILALAGFDYLDVGEEATNDSGCYARRNESGIYIGGGR